MGRDLGTEVPDSERVSFHGLLGIGATYFVAHWIAFLFPDAERVLMSVWPAGGVGLAALLLTPRRSWPTIAAVLFVAGNLANLLVHRPFLASLGFMAANVIESVGCAWFITHDRNEPVSFGRPREVLALLGAAIIVNAGSASLGAGTAVLVGGASYWVFWKTWWISDSLGILVVTPAIVSWARGWREFVRMSGWRALEAVVFLCVWGALVWLVFDQDVRLAGYAIPPYVLVAVLVWPALRFGPPGTSAALILLGCMAIPNSTADVGPSPWEGIKRTSHLELAQVYLGVVTTMGLLLSSSYWAGKVAVRAVLDGDADLRAILNAATESIFLMDRGGRLLAANDVAIQLMGRPRDELTGRSVFALVPPEVRERRQPFLDRAVETKRPVTFEDERNGRCMRHCLCPICDAAGDAVRFAVYSRDITEPKRAEELLRASEEKYRTLFENADDAIVIASPDARILAVNPHAVERFRYSLGDFLSMTIDQLDGPGDAPQVPARITSLMERGHLSFETRHRRKDGSLIPTEVNAIRIVWDGRPAIMSICRDLTVRKRLEEEKRRLEDQNRQLQKSESLSRMAGAVAHHFNNQLHAIAGNIEMAMDEVFGNDNLAQCLDEAMKAVHTASAISSLMLTYLGDEPGERRALDLSEVCRGDLVRFRAVLPNNVEFETELVAPGPIAMADSEQLERLMFNLVTNAWEAGSSGTCVVRVSVSIVPVDELPEHHLFPIDFVPSRKHYACVAVADTGCGIEPERIESLFDPFYSSKFTGRGLGLAVVLGVVRAHRGAIAVESRPGRGSVFRVFLPLAQGVSASRSDGAC